MREGRETSDRPAELAADDTHDTPQARADAGDQREPRLRLPLKTMDDVKAELARLYREGKAGRRPIPEVSKLANVLGILGRLIEGVDLAARIEALEEGGKR